MTTELNENEYSEHFEFIRREMAACDLELSRTVAQARLDGHSWTTIAAWTGMRSKQAAAQKFKDATIRPVPAPLPTSTGWQLPGQTTIEVDDDAPAPSSARTKPTDTSARAGCTCGWSKRSDDIFELNQAIRDHEQVCPFKTPYRKGK